MDLIKLTIVQAREGLKNKEFSATELASAYFEQIEKRDKEVHAYLTLTQDLALAQAKKADERIAQGLPLEPLEGMPCSIKDLILVEGIKCTAGSKILENYIAPYDATVIKKLKQAGAVLLGKTNLDEFAMGSSTENSAYGATGNPQDLKCVPGGSSGGSAASVAGGEALFSLGTDTGGSIRQPASFCGVVGLKPTYGAVSRYGAIAMASSLDQIGPLAKNVEDCKAVFDVIKGADRQDSTSMETGNGQGLGGSYRQALSGYVTDKLSRNGLSNREKLNDLRVGLPKEYFAQGIDPEVEKSVKAAISQLAAAGARIEEVSLPHTQYALACYYVIMPSEVSANLARYDGIKYGQSTIDNQQLTINSLLDVYLKTRGQYLGVEPRRRVMLGTYVLSAGYYDAYYLRAQKVRTKILQDFQKAFKEVDLIMAPTSPTTAFKIGEKIDDPVKMYLSDIYTVPVNLAGLPALSLPCGRVDGLPVGLQIIGKHFSEDLIFQVARVCEELLKY